MPSSSESSRARHSSGVSPRSSLPPGNSQRPAKRSPFFRLAISQRPFFSRTAARTRSGRGSCGTDFWGISFSGKSCPYHICLRFFFKCGSGERGNSWALCYNTRPMKIAMFASAVVPFAKTGGLADVAGALPKFLSPLGVEVRVVLPLYRETRKRNLPLRRVIESLALDWHGEKVRFSVWESREGALGFLMIERDEYFDRDFLYGTPQGDYPDNGERFAFFSTAAS